MKSQQNLHLFITADLVALKNILGGVLFKEGSPALTAGNAERLAFLIDGVDYSKFDALGRPRNSMNEVGPYTRFEGSDAAEYVKTIASESSTSKTSTSEASASTASDNIDELEILKANITIDGKLEDWSDIKSYSITRNNVGTDSKYNHNISFAWDGSNKLYVLGTLKQPEGKILADQAPDSPDWWSDDIFEIFLIPEIPSDEAINRSAADHYALNSKGLFIADDLKSNAKVKIIPLSNNEWSFELEVSFEENILQSINDGNDLYGKFCIELNSAGEFYILGQIGEFWAVDNYTKLKLIK